MKLLLKIIAITATAALLAVSCNDEEYGQRKEPVPVIESASVSPSPFTFGERITLNAVVSDPATNLYTLDYRLVVDGKIITSGTVPLDKSRYEVSHEIFVPLLAGLSDNTSITVMLTAKNRLKGIADKELTITGKRPAYNRLYLVTERGDVVTLVPQPANKDRYEATGLELEASSFTYRIAEKLTAGLEIDYSGAVWGYENGRIVMIDGMGEAAFTYTPGVAYITSIVFDSNTYSVTAASDVFGDNDMTLSAFDERVIDGEVFGILSRNLEKNREYKLFGALANEQMIYHLDFFERTAVDKIRFLGETGTYTLYYNTFRRHVILGVEDPAYPDYLLITGGGIGYPTKVGEIDREHVWWGFGNVRNFILMRKISEDVFQGTIFIHAKDDDWVGFKPYTDTGWSGDGPDSNAFAAFTVTGEDVLEGTGNWLPKNDIDTDAVYRLTINWVDKTVHVEKITL